MQLNSFGRVFLATANYIRKRQPFLPQPRRKVIKLKEGSTKCR